MKSKVILHYFVSFIAACLIIFIVNVVFMITNIYNEGALYNYHPEKIINKIGDNIYLTDDQKIILNEDGIEFLEEKQAGIQILDRNNNEIYSYNKPKIALNNYSTKNIIDTFISEENTVFVEEKEVEGNSYTYLVFFSSNIIKRVTYTYDATLIQKAHKFPILIAINIIIIFIISFLYAFKITKPITRVIEKIEALRSNDYSIKRIDNGIYCEVEECLNELAVRLDSNEKEREMLEEMKEEWISNISHDIKTPLTSIIGNTEILSDTEYEIDDEIRVKCCNTILNKSEYIKTLVEDLNLSTRLKNNTLILNKKEINIVSLIRHVIINIINDEKYNYKNINFNYSEENIILQLDEKLMKRVFVNLILNAFIHNDNNVMINIDIKRVNNNGVNITIADNGKGVSEDELKNIFKRYYRGTNTRKKIEGSGLGMAIAHDIIKAHEGEITIESKIDEGFKIEILLYR